ncbi:MAG: radical SAM protein [Elusimicrobiota bacterium]
MEQPVESRLAPSFLPATVALELTYRCNHACLFCSCPWYSDGYEPLEELDLSAWKRLVSKLCGMGVMSIAFTGGEPLLKEGLAELVESAAGCEAEHVETRDGRLVSWKAPPKLYLLSNGKAMSRDVLELCRRLDVNLSLSLPGLETYAEHTCAGTTAEHVLSWFREARGLGVSTTAGITVTSRNIHELYETVSAALLAGADTVLLNRFMPGGRGLRNRGLELSADQIPVMLDTAEEVLRAAGRYGNVGTELPKCLFDASKYVNLKVGTRCSAAKGFFCVDPSGYVRVCNHSRVRLARTDELDSLPQDPYWKRFALADYLPPSCVSCTKMGLCDGGCREAAHIVGGEVDSEDPLLFRKA